MEDEATARFLGHINQLSESSQRLTLGTFVPEINNTSGRAKIDLWPTISAEGEG